MIVYTMKKGFSNNWNIQVFMLSELNLTKSVIWFPKAKKKFLSTKATERDTGVNDMSI